MSTATRLLNQKRNELKQKIISLEARIKTAANSLAREKYEKELKEARLQLQRLN